MSAMGFRRPQVASQGKQERLVVESYASLSCYFRSPSSSRAYLVVMSFRPLSPEMSRRCTIFATGSKRGQMNLSTIYAQARKPSRSSSLREFRGRDPPRSNQTTHRGDQSSLARDTIPRRHEQRQSSIHWDAHAFIPKFAGSNR